MKLSITTNQISWAKPTRVFTPDPVESLKDDEIFVFGDNLSYRHGAGAALAAKKNFGAIDGVGHQIVGKSLGIPTKKEDIRTLLTIEEISREVNFAKSIFANNYNKVFLVSKIGCGLANPYRWEKDGEEKRIAEIAPLFSDCTPNVVLPIEFHKYI